MDPDLHDTFEEDVVRGLTAPRGEKRIPARHLYDRRGSELFGRITELDEYYLTRAESSIIDGHGPAIGEAVGAGAVLVEPGAADGSKAEALLRRLDRPRVFAPIEISAAPLREAAERIATRMPELAVRPVCAEFLSGLAMLADLPPDGRVVFFPGSTIGNLDRPHRHDLLCAFARFVGEGGRVLLGYDLVKDPRTLERAYDDEEGVSAAFALNVIDRINRELGAGLVREEFSYRSRWVAEASHIEMGLVCHQAQRTSVAGTPVYITDGEFVLTEHSHKFTDDAIATEAGEAGMSVAARWTDPDGLFGLALLAR